MTARSRWEDTCTCQGSIVADNQQQQYNRKEQQEHAERFNKQWNVIKRQILDGGLGKPNNLLWRRKRELGRGPEQRGEPGGSSNRTNKQVMTKKVSYHGDVIPPTQAHSTPTPTRRNNLVGDEEASQGNKPLGLSTRE